MIQTAMTAQEQFAKAFLVDQEALERARCAGDIIAAEGALRDAFAEDVRPFLADYRRRRGLAENPLAAFQESGYAQKIARERGPNKTAGPSSYA